MYHKEQCGNEFPLVFLDFQTFYSFEFFVIGMFPDETIKYWCKKMAINDGVIERAVCIYHTLLNNNLVRGRQTTLLMASSVYAACRETGTPRDLNDVGLVSGIKRKDIAKYYRKIVRELDLKIPLIDPIQCIERIARILEISEKTRICAVNILKSYRENNTDSGNDPMGLAGGALYISCVNNGEKWTQKNIAYTARVSEQTIMNRCKSLRESLDL